jgi:predicted  nucleic acid-binding Zn-ribbon protein
LEFFLTVFYQSIHLKAYIVYFYFKSNKISHNGLPFFKSQKELDDLETDISILEEQKLRLTDELTSGVTDYNEIQRLSDELKKITDDLDTKSMRWLEIQEEV